DCPRRLHRAEGWNHIAVFSPARADRLACCIAEPAHQVAGKRDWAKPNTAGYAAEERCEIRHADVVRARQFVRVARDAAGMRGACSFQRMIEDLSSIWALL